MKKTTLALMITASLYSVNSQADWLNAGKDLLGKAQEEVKKATGDSNTQSASIAGLSNSDIGKAFKEALSKGSETVVANLGVKDGFNKDPSIHIPLPKNLQKVKSVLAKFGKAGLMDDLELKINRAAELATPQAKALFLGAIQDMSFDDVQKIYKGPSDSATQYLQSKTSKSLKSKMAPIVEKSMQEVGAIASYDKAMSKYKDLPFVPNVKADITNHVISGGMKGMFHYIAAEEKSIRENPVKQTTELLKKVFGK